MIQSRDLVQPNAATISTGTVLNWPEQASPSRDDWACRSRRLGIHQDRTGANLLPRSEQSAGVKNVQIRKCPVARADCHEKPKDLVMANECAVVPVHVPYERAFPPPFPGKV